MPVRKYENDRAISLQRIAKARYSEALGANKQRKIQSNNHRKTIKEIVMEKMMKQSLIQDPSIIRATTVTSKSAFLSHMLG